MKPRAFYQSPRKGYCTTCGCGEEEIITVESGNWITRFCDKCFDDMVQQIKTYRKTKSNENQNKAGN